MTEIGGYNGGLIGSPQSGTNTFFVENPGAENRVTMYGRENSILGVESDMEDIIMIGNDGILQDQDRGGHENVTIIGNQNSVGNIGNTIESTILISSESQIEMTGGDLVENTMVGFEYEVEGSGNVEENALHGPITQIITTGGDAVTNTVVGYDNEIDANAGDVSEGVAIGYRADLLAETAAVESGVAVGESTSIENAADATAVGARASATADDAVALGQSTTASNVGEGAIGVDQLRFGALPGTIPDTALGFNELKFAIDTANSELNIIINDDNNNIQTVTMPFN